ncbi:Helicase conserved C-terminal domain-containing protein [Nocardioides alpinus]|uniref:ATP-dependent helicase n=1 Tax=Nocardioides alpinus TaxID=748909 RepID=A0A1I0Y6N2_9ACTN|nr:DEAD/DEAH box helicase [Nocardioides alpinus]PKH39045.1 ATP-dependent helicase [Nocardioides alpinus]SFB08487.1 Helicase conserved C-terminal domain-containing protein [Nocardioides alpinus]
MAQRQRSRGNRRTPAHARHKDNEGIVPVLARAVRELESAVQRGPLAPGQRVRFQVVALLAREHRTDVRASTELTDAQKADELKRLDGIATILAKTATRDPSLFGLLSEESRVTDSARDLRLELLRKAGIETVPDEPKPDDESGPGLLERKVIPQSVIQHQLANPFLVPDFDIGNERRSTHGRLATWELLGPLFRSFELGGSSSCMALPEATSLKAPGKLELMPHQARMIESAAEGHRTFLLADEPGLGKTAQALLAAQAANAFPLLVVCPNVVKTNWARETERWIPRRRATVIHGDGDQVDAFADVIIVNYEILDRHVGWLGEFGFRGMVVDEAHFIKNKTSQRSRHVLELSERLRARTARPLLMALTGTPLINDIEDFRAIWQFLGWIDDRKPMPRLMESLEETDLTPADHSFYPAARKAVIDMGIVRRRKVDVAADIPARRIADIPVELDDEDARSIRSAEKELARRLVERYKAALETRRTGSVVDGIDHELVRRVATWEREEMDSGTSGENVFSMFRRIGRAKAGLSADYAAQLARNVGKVVFFARHIDVMDVAEDTFTRRGLKHVSIRGDQSAKAREKAITSFVNDPDVQVIVCSLAAAGVGVNLQVASNVVLAELSWTDAEQTQAIDRVHRIGQSDPVTAWRIIAAQTIDTRIAELIDSKAGLAARALDGSDEEVSSSANIQTEALVALLTDALERELG